MATEVKQTYFAWSQGESTERDGPQGVSVSQTLDHGSISFGRFELESLSWEKWSVFTNDRRNEEFGKFNGLVAQKKAYFEEYYKKIRELKASQQQNQQTELTLEYNGDGSDSSQTAEEEQGADLETPTGSGAPVDDFAEEAHETTSEHGLQYYDDHRHENVNMEFSSSNLSSAAGVLQQTNADVRGTVCGDNFASKMDVRQQNTSSGHDDSRMASEATRTPRRIIEKDSRLRHTPKIIPKSIKNLSKSVVDYTFASERPGSVKPTTSMNQKTKLVQKPNAVPQKMAGTPERSKLTGLRRPSSAGVQRPSTGERQPTAKANSKTPADVSTPRRPSTAERRPITRDHAQKQANVTTPRRPSTSERRPIKRESAAKHADISTVRRPLTGERPAITRDVALKTDLKTSSKARPTVAHPKSGTTTVANPKKAVTPNVARSSKLEPKSINSRLKGPSALDGHSTATRSKRMDLQVSGKQRSSSVNLPPRKIFSSSVGEPAGETISRTKKKEGIQATVQSRVSTSKRTTGNLKTRDPNPPAPPPPPRRPSRMMSKPTASTSSIGGRKPKASAPQWH
ncbi:unnamed protein product [Urochloa humidicola]